MGHLFYFYFFYLNEVIFGINTCIWGNFGNFLPKTVCATHVNHFSSKKIEMTNRVLTLKILKTLLEYIATF
jgi:hypothetical protein